MWPGNFPSSRVAENAIHSQNLNTSLLGKFARLRILLLGEHCPSPYKVGCFALTVYIKTGCFAQASCIYTHTYKVVCSAPTEFIKAGCFAPLLHTYTCIRILMQNWLRCADRMHQGWLLCSGLIHTLASLAASCQSCTPEFVALQCFMHICIHNWVAWR